jgi:hypothetical protein
MPLIQFCPIGHALPHTPQFDASVWRLTQRPGAAPQSVSPERHDDTHVPAEHDAEPPTGGAQLRPQAPQWLTLLLRFVSQPLAALPSQSPNPATQRKRHAPDEHDAV